MDVVAPQHVIGSAPMQDAPPSAPPPPDASAPQPQCAGAPQPPTVVKPPPPGGAAAQPPSTVVKPPLAPPPQPPTPATAPLPADAGDATLANLDKLRNSSGPRPTADIRGECQQVMQGHAAVFRIQDKLEEGCTKMDTVCGRRATCQQLNKD